MQFRSLRAAPAAQRGFTLIELMVVVAIIGMLAAIVAHNVTDHADTAKIRTAQVNARQIAGAVKMFYAEVGRLPELGELTGSDGTKAYIEELPLDPWGRAFKLRPGARRGAFEIVSAGPNTLSGDDDDIGSRSSPTESGER